MCPPVPPPAIINVVMSLSAGLLREIEKQSNRDEAGDQRRASVAYKRQRQSFGRHQTERDAHVDERLNADHQREPECRVEIELILAVARDPESAPEQKCKERDDRQAANESELL